MTDLLALIACIVTGLIITDAVLNRLERRR